LVSYDGSKIGGAGDSGHSGGDADHKGGDVVGCNDGGSMVSSSNCSGTSWPAGAKSWETAMKAVAVGAAERPQRLGRVGAVSSSLSLSSPASHRCFVALLVHLARGVVKDGGEGAIAGSGSGSAGAVPKGECGNEG
jgi:hypothetical protein